MQNLDAITSVMAPQYSWMVGITATLWTLASLFLHLDRRTRHLHVYAVALPVVVLVVGAFWMLLPLATALPGSLWMSATQLLVGLTFSLGTLVPLAFSAVWLLGLGLHTFNQKSAVSTVRAS